MSTEQMIITEDPKVFKLMNEDNYEIYAADLSNGHRVTFRIHISQSIGLRSGDKAIHFLKYIEK